MEKTLMRHLLVLLIVGLVLAVSGPAWAIGIPFTQAYNGPTYWHISDWDAGTFYNGLLTNGSPALNGHTYTPSQLQKTGPSGGVTGEDSWGIFRVESIYTAQVDPFGTDTITIGSTELYDFGATLQTTEIMGLFHGRVDDFISFVDLTPLNLTDPLTQVIQSHGDTIDLYTQPKGSAESLGGLWSNGLGGPSDRLAANQYKGVGYSALNTTIVGSDLALTGGVQLGFQSDGVISYFTPNATGNTGSGTFGLYISWTGGSQLPIWDTNVFPIGYSLGGITADLRLQGSITPTGLPTGDPWLVHTSDPGTTSVVPEPVTMAGMLLGIGCLSRYIRKRR